MSSIVIAAETNIVKTKAKQLADQLRLPLIILDHDVVPASCQFLLVVTENYLELHSVQDKKLKPMYVDFLSGALRHRREYGGGAGQFIARAVGVKGKEKPMVIDATAGLGGDSFVLAYLGCKVLMLERSPVIAALLQDGLERASQDPSFVDISLNLICADAIGYLQTVTEKNKPDVIYLDPMFPERTKSALVKKEMRILRELVGEDLDAVELLKVALTVAKKRVVVKRPRLAPCIEGPKPSLQFKGKSGRFDVYLIKGT